LSIFWTFIPADIYFDKSRFSDRVKIGMVVANIYHFFIRKGCTAQCFTNLFNTFSSEKLGIKTLDQKRLTLEVLAIGYISGIVLMPGAHGQFTFWFTCFVPLLVEMVGLPSFMTFWIYAYFYPIQGDPKYQHIFLIAITLWLLTVGP